MKNNSRAEIEEKINMKAWTNSHFKTELLKNPRQALKEFGLEIPSHAKIVVHEEDENTWHLTIRKAPPTSKKMNDSELKLLQAGDCGGCR